MCFERRHCRRRRQHHPGLFNDYGGAVFQEKARTGRDFRRFGQRLWHYIHVDILQNVDSLVWVEVSVD